MLFTCYVHSSVLGWECKKSSEPASKASLSLRAKAVVTDLQRFVTLGREAVGSVGQRHLARLARQLCLSSRDQASSEAVVAPFSAFTKQPWWGGMVSSGAAGAAFSNVNPSPQDSCSSWWFCLQWFPSDLGPGTLPRLCWYLWVLQVDVYLLFPGQWHIAWLLPGLADPCWLWQIRSDSRLITSVPSSVCHCSLPRRVRSHSLAENKVNTSYYFFTTSNLFFRSSSIPTKLRHFFYTNSGSPKILICSWSFQWNCCALRLQFSELRQMLWVPQSLKFYISYTLTLQDWDYSWNNNILLHLKIFIRWRFP